MPSTPDTETPKRSRDKVAILLWVGIVASLFLVVEMGVGVYRQANPSSACYTPSYAGTAGGAGGTGGGGGGFGGGGYSVPDGFYPFGECGSTGGPLWALAQKPISLVQQQYEETIGYHVNVRRDMRGIPTEFITLAVGDDVCITHPVREEWDVHFEGENAQGSSINIPPATGESSQGRVRDCRYSAGPNTLWVYYRAGEGEVTPGDTVRAYMVNGDNQSLVADISSQ